MPYLHIEDVCSGFLRIVHNVPTRQTLMLMPHEATQHVELFRQIRSGLGLSTRPLHIQSAVLETLLRAEKLLWATPEQAWMLKLIDRPILVDQRRTESLLNWKPNPALLLEAKLPLLIDRFRNARPEWDRRQANRAAHNYVEQRA
jgi:hypothetical protein